MYFRSAPCFRLKYMLTNSYIGVFKWRDGYEDSFLVFFLPLNSGRFFSLYLNDR